MIVINSSTRQFNIPGADMTFGVEADAGSERKYFQCPRYVGNNLDLMGCFVRLNYRNANGEVDSYLVEDLTVDGDNVLFSWELSPKVTAYKGQIRFVLCVVGPDTKVAWHTTLGTGIVLEGLEPDHVVIQSGTADVVAQLIAMVNEQTEAVEAEGANQIKAVQTAAQTAQSDAVAQIEAKGKNVRESIPDDYTSLENTVDSLVRGRAGAIVCEAAGTAVVVKDASNQAMQGLRIFGRSTQNGVPTPDAPVEIVSVESPVVTVAGKNLLPNAATNESYSGVTIVVNGDKSITVNGTATGNVFYAPFRFTFKAGQSYILSGCPRNGSADTYFMYINNLGGVRDYGDGVTVTLDEDFTSDVGFSIRSGTTVNNLTFYPMIKVGDVVDEYEPSRTSQTVELTHILPGIPVTSGGNYTDNNGQQWICDEVDLERGVYVRRINAITLTGNEAVANVSGDYAVPIAKSAFDDANRRQCLCNYYPAKSRSELGQLVKQENQIGVSANLGYVRFVDTLHFPNTDIAGFTAFLAEKYAVGNPVVVSYLLTKPAETPLSETEIAAYRAMHTNYPNTTVLNDAGAHMVVKYAADTKLYIDNKIKEAFA